MLTLTLFATLAVAAEGVPGPGSPEPGVFAPLFPAAQAAAQPAQVPAPVEVPANLLPAPKPEGPGEEPVGEAPAAPDRWLFMRSVQGSWVSYLLDGQRINVYGWTEGSYTLSSEGKTTWPILFQSPTEQLLLNQNWLVIERPVVTSGTNDPSFGFRIDSVLPGSDARFLQQRGLLNGQTGTNQIDLYQFYAEAYFPNVGRGLDVKVGRVAVPYMAEVSNNVANPLFSHTYAYYYNPFTHTGVMTTLKLSDQWAVGGWFTLGNDVFFDPAATGMFVGTLQWTSLSKRDIAFLCVGISSGRFDVSESFSNQDHVDLVYTHIFNPRMSYILDTGIGWESNIPGIGNATWSWAANYLIYDFTSWLKGVARLEFFDDAQGFKTGFEGLYTAVTAGLTFKPYKSLLIRPELRYDYNNDSRAYGDKHGLFTASSDVIFRW